MNSRKAACVKSLNCIAVSVAILLLAFAGCRQQDAPVETPNSLVKKVDVLVVNYPLAFLAQRVGGDLVEVSFPVPTEDDPAYWEPDENDVARFQSADLVLLNGADYAKWTLRTSLPWSRTVITTRDVEDRYIEVPNAITHAHGPEGEHSHAGLASETWIDPQLAVSQAQVVKEELQKLLPDLLEAIEENFDDLKKELLRVDEDFRAAFARSTLPWTASYPAFRYLGRRYGLDLQTMNWEPSEFPSDEQWAELDKLIAQGESSLMLWTEKPMPKTLERLEQRGVRVVVFRLAAHRYGSDDYLEVMRQNLNNIKVAIASQSQQ